MKVRRPAAFAALALVLAAATAAAAAAQSPDEILAKHAKAVDPEGKAATLQGMRMTANVEIPAAGMTATMLLVQRAPNQQAMTIGLPGLGEMRQGFDGTTAWASDPMQGPRLVTGTEAAGAADGAQMRALTRPADLFTSSEVAGEAEVDGQKCVKVKHTWKSGRVSTDCYSTETWLILESVATQSTPQGDLEAVTRYADFRAVNGIMMPHKLTIATMGMQQLITATSLEFGEQPESAVEPPAEVKALIKKP